MKHSANARLTRGSHVVLRKVPPGLTRGLPPEDQWAIWEIVGRPVVLSDYVEDGRAELKFVDNKGVIHFIHVNPQYVSAGD